MERDGTAWREGRNREGMERKAEWYNGAVSRTREAALAKSERGYLTEWLWG